MRADTPVGVSSDEARQMAIRELSKAQYHRGSLPSAPASAQPSSAPPPSPRPLTPPPHVSAPSHALAVVLIILAVFLLVVVVLLVLRRLGKPRTENKSKQKSEGKGRRTAGTVGDALTGAALHRHNAQRAAAAGDWAEAIRERFRAVIATLDERGLLPERVDRTADEAARDAGALLPAHAEALAAAAHAFDEVEYGEYVGTPEAYAVIGEVDEAVCTEQRGTLQLPTAIAPTVPGGAR